MSNETMTEREKQSDVDRGQALWATMGAHIATLPSKAEVDREVWAEYERLCRPDSPDFIVDSPDYYAFFTETLFRGQVTG